MALPKLPPPPKTGSQPIDDWLNTLYNWAGGASIEGLTTVNGSISRKSSKVPGDPVIAQQLLSIPIGLQFQFNFNQNDVVDGYWIYKGTTSNAEAANKWDWIPQSSEGGVATVRDNVGSATYYYWVQAVNSAGRSAKVYAGAPGVAPPTPLSPTQTMTVIRPSSSTGNYTNQAAAYDNNLNQSASATVIGVQAKLSEWSGFPAAAGTPSGIVLKVASSMTGNDSVIAQIDVSVDGGGSYTNLSIDTDAFVERTDSLSLSPTQDMTLVRVRGSMSGLSAGVGSDRSFGTHLIAEIWAEVTT
jgi:hypothetical protein